MHIEHFTISEMNNRICKAKKSKDDLLKMDRGNLYQNIELQVKIKIIFFLLQNKSAIKLLQKTNLHIWLQKDHL